MVDKKATARLAGDVILCNALKIVANSVYGLMAFSRYPSYSPMYSTITGSGRWLLEVLYLVCKFYPHCTWTYGDTDSLYCSYATESRGSRTRGTDSACHGRRGEDMCRMSEEIRSIVGRILDFTPFASVGLSKVMPANTSERATPGPVYPRMMVLKSKMYALLCPGGGLELRGVSAVLETTVFYTCNSQPSPTQPSAWLRKETARRYTALPACRKPGDTNVVVPPLTMMSVDVKLSRRLASSRQNIPCPRGK